MMVALSDDMYDEKYIQECMTFYALHGPKPRVTIAMVMAAYNRLDGSEDLPVNWNLLPAEERRQLKINAVRAALIAALMVSR